MTAISAGGGPVPKRRPDATELMCRLTEVARHDGNLRVALRAVTQDLDCDGRDSVIIVAITVMRVADRAMTRLADLVGELREHIRDNEIWNAQRTLDEIENCLVRSLP